MGVAVDAIALAVQVCGSRAAVVEVEPAIWELVVAEVDAPPQGGTWLAVNGITFLVACHPDAIGIEVYDESRLNPEGLAKRARYRKTAAASAGPS